MSYRISASIVVLVALFGVVFSHGLLLTPTPRTGTDDQVRDPCTASTTAPIVANLTAYANRFLNGENEVLRVGGEFTFSWRYQPCHCKTNSVSRILISYDGTPENLQQIASKSTGARDGNAFTETMTVKLPSGRASQRALIQWVWDNDETRHYFGCADVRVVGTDSNAILCDSNLVKCDSASTMGFSLFAFFVAFVALLL